jgi:NhaA family Na+:H+ antiporter
MSEARLTNRLDRPVDESFDHVLGPPDAEITLVEYGSYACPYCRAANDEIAQVRDELGERLRYVFRHRPITGSDIARRAAELSELAIDAEAFWHAHVALMSRSAELTEDDLVAVAGELGLNRDDEGEAEEAVLRARERVEADEASARASGVRVTPTFFINGRRYDGPWDRSSLDDAMLGTLGHRVRAAALDFASWGPSAGVLLLLATVLAILWTNSPMAAGYEAFWEMPLGLAAGDFNFAMSLRHWVNDGLLTIFFLVVGLEIKREFTVGHLATRRSAALPIAAAIGGMAVPALIYSLVIPEGAWAHGWGVPMATDTAFAVALIVMLGRRVPIELRIFLTAAAIVDDIGAIIVVAVFYSSELHLGALAAAAAVTAALAALNRAHVYRVSPYAFLGVALWALVLAGGVHATLAGVVLALFIPTRPPANLRALSLQADTIIAAEAADAGEVLRHGPSPQALRALDAIHDRIESPAARLLRHAGARSSYAVLPIFALANAGATFEGDIFAGHWSLITAIVLGLTFGKPLGIFAVSAAAVLLKAAVKPEAYTWRQLAGAGALCGIGFTMSLFIAGQAFPAESDFAAAKIAVFGASVLSALIGVALLFSARTPSPDEA